MLKATEVQQMIGAKHNEVVAYGYAPMMSTANDRLTYYVWFADGLLHRAGTTADDKVKEYTSTPVFDPNYFTANIKRWYAASMNEKLVSLFATFGNGLSTTPGGSAGHEPPDVKQYVTDLIVSVMESIPHKPAKRADIDHAVYTLYFTNGMTAEQIADGAKMPLADVKKVIARLNAH
jgi:hypothetical protein